MSATEEKVQLKLMVDRKTSKVVFAEANKEFVDFLFHLLSLPLVTVVNHLKDEEMGGCLGSLSGSLNSLYSEYFEPNIDSRSVQKQCNAVSIPKLSLDDGPSTMIMYKCPSHDQVSFKYGLTCSKYGCFQAMIEMFTYVNASTSNNATQGFVKGSIPFMVMDDLEVKPMTIALIKYYGSGLYNLEEKVVQVGIKEAKEILKASLKTNAVLTTVFLGNDN